MVALQEVRSMLDALAVDARDDASQGVALLAAGGATRRTAGAASPAAGCAGLRSPFREAV